MQVLKEIGVASFQYIKYKDLYIKIFTYLCYDSKRTKINRIIREWLNKWRGIYVRHAVIKIISEKCLMRWENVYDNIKKKK